MANASLVQYNFSTQISGVDLSGTVFGNDDGTGRIITSYEGMSITFAGRTFSKETMGQDWYQPYEAESWLSLDGERNFFIVRIDSSIITNGSGVPDIQTGVGLTTDPIAMGWDDQPAGTYNLGMHIYEARDDKDRYYEVNAWRYSYPWGYEQYGSWSPSTWKMEAVNVADITTPVPEPETLAMMLLGLPMMAWTVRRRKFA